MEIGVFVEDFKRKNFEDMFMSMIAIIFFLSMIFTPIELMSFNIFTNYSKLPPEQNVQNLTVDQINNPTDPYINYNLGVALYQSDKFDAAKNNFQRCLIHAKNKNLKERCYFNLGNSFYKNGLSGFPLNWQNKDTDVDQAKIGQAIQEVKEAIKNYERVLELNKENTHAKTNLEKAKDMLKKLQEKMKQQQQNQQDKKDKQDQNKDENKDQNQDSQNQDSQNKDQQQKQDSRNQDSSSDRKESNSQQNQQQQPAQDKKDSSGQSGNDGENRDQEKSDQEKNNNEKQQDLKHDQAQSGQQKDQQQNNQGYGNQQEQQNQEQEKQASAAAAQSGDDKQDSAKQKSIRAMLDNLQNYESNLQKARVVQKAQDNNEPLKSNQKPW